MVKEIIKYTDFNGNECEEVAYFNLTKSECAKLQLGMKEGLSNYIKEVVESNNNKAMVELFEKIVLDSYGVKSEDGKRFVKSEELKTEFSQSAAYDELFFTLATDGDKAKQFIEGVIPHLLSELNNPEANANN